MRTSYESKAAMSGIPTITRENKVDERVLATFIRSLFPSLKPSFRPCTLPMKSKAVTSGIPAITDKNKVDERVLATLIRSRALEMLLPHHLHLT
jgi:hypothetical protein